MDKVINKKTFIVLPISFILTIFLWHNLNLSGNSFLTFFIFFACYTIIKHTTKLSEILKSKNTHIFALIFTIAEIIGNSVNTDYTLNHIFDGWFLTNFAGYYIIGLIVISNIYYFWGNNTLKYHGLFKNKMLVFAVCIMLIFSFWLPYLIRYFPGILSPDSYAQLQQIVGEASISDSHPIIHTGFISIFVKIGLTLTNNIGVGVAMYSIASMLIMALLDTTVILYLIKKKVPEAIVVIVLLFYMLYPINGVYSITMWKDIIFSGIIPVFIILCIELITNTDVFISKKKNIVFFICTALLVMLLRHNGLYVVILSMPAILIALRQYWKVILKIFLIILACYLAFTFFKFNILQAEKGSVAEAMSIPLQQIARVEKYYRDEFDDETKTQINSFFTIENIGKNYKATISDPVKYFFDTHYFASNKAEFIELWLKLFLRYPKDFIEAFVSNSYGYYYIEATHWTTSAEGTTTDLVSFLTSLSDKRDIPIISMIFSIGMICFTALICFGYKMYNKKFKYIVIYFPIFILWLTLIASPVYCEFRYAYPILLSLPLFISINFIDNDKKNIEK